MLKQFFILVGVALFVFSCERQIELDNIDAPPILVIQSSFEPSDDDAHEIDYIKVSVLKSVSVLSDDTLEYVDYGKLTILRNNIPFEEMELSHDKDGVPYYQTSFAPPSGGELFKINVDVPGFESFIISAEFPRKPSLDTIMIDGKDVDIKGKGNLRRHYFDVYVQFDDDINNRNYYQMKVFGKISNKENGHTVIDEKFTQFEFWKDQDIDFDIMINNNINTPFAGVYFDDKTFNGESNKIISFKLSKILDFTTQDIAQIGVEFNAINHKYFLYNQSIQKQINQIGHTTPTSTYSNINQGNGENGYGIFGGLNSSWKTVDY